ncbi:hypothetical protein D3C71_1776310 [compost metagenome]
MGVNLLDGGYVVRRSVGEDQRSGVGHKRIMRRAWRQGKLGFLMLKIKKVIPIRETKKWRMTIFAMRREPLRAAFGRGKKPG